MCGIVGYVGHRQAADVILDGLKRLEYRGYDSAGVVISPEQGSSQSGDLKHSSPLRVMKKAGKLSVLADALAGEPLTGTLGLGHTRWATHGKPSDVNAHPHLSKTANWQSFITASSKTTYRSNPACKERVHASPRRPIPRCSCILSKRTTGAIW